MSLGQADRQARARRRLIWGVAKATAALALIGLAGVFAWQTGTSLAELDVRRKSEEIARLSSQIQTLQSDNSALKASAAQAQAQAREWEQRYAADVPTGDPKILLDLAARKLDEGVDMERLTFLIGAAANPRVCDEETERKRLLVKTPIGKVGKDGSAAFAERRITVTAEGEPVVNESGQKEAWFDPARPITVAFAQLDGRIAEASGVVPLRHQMVIGSSEFHFSIDVDERRGFAIVTSERCNFP
jgi:hypothetical protein